MPLLIELLALVLLGLLIIFVLGGILWVLQGERDITADTSPIIDPESIRTDCSWCGQYMRGPQDSDRISHGICATCRDKYNEQLDRSYATHQSL